MTLNDIRRNEQKSHITMYSEHHIYEPGSWLSKPVKTVMDQLEHFSDRQDFSVLDLGCGVGRNAIAIAQQFRSLPCHIDCVDILPYAIEKLNTYAEEFQVRSSINGIVSAIDQFQIPQETYDLIIAISALEHMDSRESLLQKLQEIRQGTKKNGMVCIIMNSEVLETEKESGKQVPAQFEINLSQEVLKVILKNTFSGWNIIKNTVQHQQYDIPRENGIHELHTNVITYVASK